MSISLLRWMAKSGLPRMPVLTAVWKIIAKLRSAGFEVRQDAPDVELILHAYSAFGKSFLDHLIGDFAFALWDGRGKKLICARDHFGVRPFFYVITDKVFLFASDLGALLHHPSVSRELDVAAIGDFLLFGSRQDPEASTYHDIRRLKAASQIGSTRRGLASSSTGVFRCITKSTIETTQSMLISSINYSSNLSMIAWAAIMSRLS